MRAHQERERRQQGVARRLGWNALTVLMIVTCAATLYASSALLAPEPAAVKNAAVIGDGGASASASASSATAAQHMRRATALAGVGAGAGTDADADADADVDADVDVDDYGADEGDLGDSADQDQDQDQGEPAEPAPGEGLTMPQETERTLALEAELAAEDAELRRAGLLPPNPEDDPRIRVLVFRGDGASVRSWNNIVKVLRCLKAELRVRLITSLQDISPQTSDVVVIPGGLMSKMRNNYRQHGLSIAKLLREYVREGGGYVGVCAGAYLAQKIELSPYHNEAASVGLGYFAGASDDDGLLAGPPGEAELGRGVGPALAKADVEGMKLFYAFGPVFLKEPSAEVKGKQISKPKVLMRARGKLFLRGTATAGPTWTTRLDGSPILVMNDFGKGRVIIGSGHPESDVSRSKGNDVMVTGKASTCDLAQAKLFQKKVFLAAARRRQGPAIEQTLLKD